MGCSAVSLNAKLSLAIVCEVHRSWFDAGKRVAQGQKFVRKKYTTVDSDRACRKCCFSVLLAALEQHRAAEESWCVLMLHVSRWFLQWHVRLTRGTAGDIWKMDFG